jgi:hypothetical protein
MDMKLRRRKKSAPARAASLAGDYLKLKTAGKAAKGAGKAAGTTAKGVVAYKGTQGLVKRLPWVAGVGVAIAAAFVGAKALRGGGEPATS